MSPFEEQIVRPDGSVADVEIALTRVDDFDAGAASAVVWTVHEISERKRADARCAKAKSG